MTLWTELIDVPHSIDFVDVGGLRTRRLRAGNGDPVVFLHGTSGHLEAFVNNIAAHAAHFEVHAIDMMGHGLTDGVNGPYRIADYVDHLRNYLLASGLGRVQLIGESLGGWVAARLAARFPVLVDKLILVAPGGTVANPEVMKRIRDSTKRAVLGDDIEETRRRLNMLMYNPDRDVTEELVEIRHLLYHRPAFVAAIDNLLALQEMGNRQEDLLRADECRQIEAPTLIVWGAENPFGAIPEAEFLKENIRHSRLVIFEQCGHWPQKEYSDKFNQLSLEHLLAS